MIFAYFSIVLYSLGLISLSIVTYNLMKVLKIHYPEFYYQERRMILTMVIVLMISMLGKLGFGAYRVVLGSQINEFLEESEIRDDWISPTFWSLNFTITELAPVSALILSFWYGLMRRNKVIRSRKYSTAASNAQSLDKSPNLLITEANDDDEFHGYNPFGIATMSNAPGREERDLTIISSVM